MEMILKNLEQHKQKIINAPMSADEYEKIKQEGSVIQKEI